MDTIMSNLPPEVSAILVKNLTILQIVAMFSIGAWNSIEVIIGVFERFRKYRGLYFWSMQIAAWGILLHAIPAQIRYLQTAPNLPMSIPFIIGWICMVSGQALVLYSRLHLVVQDVRHIRWVLWMIITNFLILHVPMTVLFYHLDHQTCRKPAATFDRIQVSGFAIQDTVICAIYVREALRALKPVFESRDPQGRRIIYQLIFVNLFGILLDALVIIAELKMHYIAVSFKTVAYSVKLKLEFHVLTQLQELTRTYPCALCRGEDATPRESTDLNIHDMISSRPVLRGPDAQAAASSGGTVCPAAVHLTSGRSSAYDFHEALRETTSTAVDSVEMQRDARPLMRSTDTQSTIEMTLLDSPK
ncbi:uncharacterized protein N7515_006037 [Penicillium bovifimosum]|uniref:DUF7703 domain-containing protein n=1 Tax=Penicillium bovifimosum TaxID=126998 RepID=A0A9W9GUB1_9EURO|nr:uncharacterized protein N7515_006037 [Penicillium bovifimosum]KAJ5129998.1 hypothetical protein N7515_006037 [Penicillium bovifimosum]